MTNTNKTNEPRQRESLIDWLSSELDNDLLPVHCVGAWMRYGVVKTDPQVDFERDGYRIKINSLRAEKASRWDVDAELGKELADALDKRYVEVQKLIDECYDLGTPEERMSAVERNVPKLYRLWKEASILVVPKSAECLRGHPSWDRAFLEELVRIGKSCDDKRSERYK